MSVGVQRVVDGVPQQWLFQGVGGAQASAGLIAAVLDLMKQAQLRMADLDAICFGAGPGSFTGLRTACAVAQGLGFGAGVPLLPVDSLLAVAEDARFTVLAEKASGRIMALLDARMDEVYCAVYAFDGVQWTPVQPAGLMRPEDVRADGATLAGNVFGVYADQLKVDSTEGPLPSCVLAAPTAAAMLRLAPQLLAAGGAVDAALALPHYIRDKVAKTTVERATEKADSVSRAQSLPLKV